MVVSLLRLGAFATRKATAEVGGSGSSVDHRDIPLSPIRSPRCLSDSTTVWEDSTQGSRDGPSGASPHMLHQAGSAAEVATQNVTPLFVRLRTDIPSPHPLPPCRRFRTPTRGTRRPRPGTNNIGWTFGCIKSSHAPAHRHRNHTLQDRRALVFRQGNADLPASNLVISGTEGSFQLTAWM